MFTYFYPLFALQAFCLYHAYKNSQDQKWYWMIIFFPVVGCLLYMYDAFYTRRTVSTITEGLLQAVNSNYNIERLERDVKFSNNTKNKIDLADAYVAVGRNKEAINIYEDCSTGYMADDDSLKRKLLQALFLDGQHEKVVQVGGSLSGDKQFRDSNERISFALALHHVGSTDLAIQHFEAMDRPFTNYDHRCAYCQFLVGIGKPKEAREKLSELLSEIDLMKGIERKTHREAIEKVRELARQLGSR